MKRLTTSIAAAAVLLGGALAMPAAAVDDDLKQTRQAMKDNFTAAKKAANSLPKFKGARVQQWRGRPQADSMDYRTFGYWLAPRNNDPSRSPIAGVWATGPSDANLRVPELPLTGGAIWRGKARGFISGERKTSKIPQLRNSRFEGTFEADAEIYAVFNIMEIAGCVGCNGKNRTNISANGTLALSKKAAGDGPAVMPVSLSVPYGVHFTAPLNSDGTWRSKNVGLSMERTENHMASTGGAWGGRLIAGDEYPASAIGEKAIGTFGAWGRHKNGNRAVLLGSFETGPGVPTVAIGDDGCSTIEGAC